MVAMTNEHAETAGQTQAGATAGRRIHRRTADRVIGGVAGGVADYLDIDPLLLRVGFAGLMIFGGAGLVLYVIAWLLIPAQGRDDSMVQQWFARLSLRYPTVASAALVLLAVVIIGGWLAGDGFGWLVSGAIEPIRFRDTALIALLVIVVGVVVLRWREGPGRSVTSMVASPASAAPAIGPGVVTEPSAAPTPRIPDATDVPPAGSLRPPRSRSPLGWYVLAAALVAVGLLAIVANATGLDVAPGQYFGAALTVLGVGLVVGAWWGRARLLILLGVFMLPIAATAALLNVPLDGGFADQAFQPKSVGEVRTDYRLTGGEIRLDLTGLPAGAEPIRVQASVGVGLLIVIVPDDARLTLDARVSGGRLSLFGNRQIGTGLADRIERSTGLGPEIVLNLDAGLGEVIVQVAGDGG